jgi:glycosyltransferase involved in cell wall biosynthesis
MAAGRPVLTNACGNLADLVQEEVIGLAVDEDPAVMAEILLDMLDNPALLQAQGKRARRAAEDRYSWDRRARAIEDFHQKVTALG